MGSGVGEARQVILVVELAKPPSWNSLYKVSKFGKVYLSKRGKEYKEEAKELIERYRTIKETYLEPVFVAYTLFTSTPNRSDLDNVLKVLNDSLEYSGVIGNDSQIYEIAATKKPVAKRKNERVVVAMYTMPYVNGESHEECN